MSIKYIVRGKTQAMHVVDFEITANSREKAVKGAFECKADMLQDVETYDEENIELERWIVIKEDGKEVEDDDTGTRLAEAEPKPPELPIQRILLATEGLIESARLVIGRWDHGDLAGAVCGLVVAMEEAEDALDERTKAAQKGVTDA